MSGLPKALSDFMLGRPDIRLFTKSVNGRGHRSSLILRLHQTTAALRLSGLRRQGRPPLVSRKRWADGVHQPVESARNKRC
jgi:hypothetical protein